MARVLVGSVGAGDAVGTIKKSMLTIAEFQSENGANWVLMDGTDVVGSDLAILKTGDAITPYLLPDARGQFLRGLDTTGTVDPDGAGRSLGDSQADAFQGHWHKRLYSTNRNVNSVFDTNLSNTGENAEDNNSVTDPISDGANGIPRTSDETRPKNITVNIFIKINN